jgi:GH24 family phage-related lysozyme (muramidase)
MSFGSHNARDHTIIFHLTGQTAEDKKFEFSTSSGNIIGGVGVYKNAGGIITSAGGGEGNKAFALISGHIWRAAEEVVEEESTKRAVEQTTNQRGVDLIKSFEGWMACWYKDAAGYPTIGYGHLIKAGESYKQGSCITQAQGESLLRGDLGTAESCVNGAVKRTLNGNQFSALVSFTFNLGCGNFKSSTLLSKLNAGDFGAVCSELARWNKAGGKVLPGLTRRRAAECDLFRS